MTDSNHQLQYAQTRHAQTRATTLFFRVIGHSRRFAMEDEEDAIKPELSDPCHNM